MLSVPSKSESGMEDAKLKEEKLEIEEEKKEEEMEQKEEEEEKEGEDVGPRMLQELDQTLGKMQINFSAPHQSEPKPKVDPSECPPSYSENSAEEKLMLSIAENFHTQYSYLYPDRKPLLLFPVNEVGVQKFVSTTLRRTLIPCPEVYDWQGCASFIADFLTLESLDCLTEVPKQLCSSTWVVQTRRGTCFEYSTLLCSLLLGAGYNAFCVSGYAVKEMCLIDLSHQECPLIKPQDTVKGKSPEKEEEVQKYRVKPARELKSTFKQRQEEKNQQEGRPPLAEQQNAESLKEDRPSDPLHGQRVHSWVLVLAGKRDISKNFFIDPLSGQSFPTSSSCFLGIESIWNHENYWVNMQDCRSGCTGMTFDLRDDLTWEYMLCGPSSSSSVASPDIEDEEQDEQDDEETEELDLFKMPRSWVTQIHISEEDMESRFPGGSKLIRYRKATLERFSPYLLKDGLVTRLTTYDDLEYTQPNTVKEWYKSRQDKLQERELKKASNVTTEHFSPGKSFCLKTHRYNLQVPETERFMEFYSKIRDDNLVTRLKTHEEMTETFHGRLDFLYYRHVIYRPLELAQKHGVQRPIQKIVVKFHRDQSKPASSDVAELIFQISQNKIEVMYHLEDDRITPNFDIFEKPSKPDDPISDKMCSSFQVTDLLEKNSPKLNMHQTFELLMEMEEKTLTSIKASEKEVRDILEVRDQEESDIEMKISFYDMARNEKARQHVETQKQLAQEKQQKKEFKNLDILASFLAQWGDPETLTKQQAVQIHANCLEHLKQRSVDMANRIQARYEKETEELQQKQHWYQKNRFNLTKQDEEEYLAYCSEAMFRIRILQLRLSRHKDSSPQKYVSLNKRLRKDSRLMLHLVTPQN
ncbi:dynein regulatory complex subunit 7 isoform X2 [Silurus meridionalis]|uniref:dynein regulatory complex subunit 7 isoform X2 n=2 Tax=Silurus meridionalis TaxID=175797 RepID=UPI001EEAE324|nr:dynein regulatory complex subunit 7 isoform X2 [Silurus meridionalis]